MKKTLIILFLLLLSKIQSNSNVKKEMNVNIYNKKQIEKLKKKKQKNNSKNLTYFEDEKDILMRQLLEGTFVYERCDNGHTPDVVHDCTRFQTDESSCCYFTYGSDIGCIKLKTRYLGSINYGDLYLECQSKFLKYFISILLNLIILF